MNAHLDPNIQSVDLVAHALKPLLNEVVLVGGCSVGLLVTDKGRPPVRETVDVDLITEVTTLSNYYKFCERLRELGFQEDGGEVICRWRKGGLIVDVMPTDEKILKFSNRWYDLAIKTAAESVLPSGLSVRHISAPLFIATKIESFYGRGKGDFIHHDIEDIINVVDGRPELLEEMHQAPHEVKNFIEEEVDDRRPPGIE